MHLTSAYVKSFTSTSPWRMHVLKAFLHLYKVKMSFFGPFFSKFFFCGDTMSTVLPEVHNYTWRAEQDDTKQRRAFNNC